MKKNLIYVADDDVAIRDVVKVFLEKYGYAVSCFDNGDLLLAEFEKNPSDFVILDVLMPGSSGFAICRELRKISYVPIIMLTARDGDMDYQTAMDLGCDDFFSKPVSTMSIVCRVNAIFRRIEYERIKHEAAQALALGTTK
ncbi:MAG: response regulator [Defluviitaleaceae bacterium]|nr:response regulator [Defluviitaleaceae bacterium]